MASPPFNIDQSLPGDSDVVSQFPGVERTYRDVTESWLLIDHNTQGRHDSVKADWKTDATFAGIASVTTVWASSDDLGDLHKRQGTNAIEWVGVPPGTAVARFDTSVPNGYTACDGTTLSRTGNGARLFALWGVAFGVGDGATTFTKPNCTGRVLVQLDAAQSVVTGATAVGVSFGSNTKTIAQANLPNVNFTISGITLNDPGHSHGLTSGSQIWHLGTGGGAGGGGSSGTQDVTVNIATTGITISNQGSAASGGSGTGLSVTQPGIAVNYVIKL